MGEAEQQNIKMEAEAEAEAVQRSGVRRMAAFAVLFLLWQTSYYAVSASPGDQVRTVDLVRTFGFLVWVVALLALFATGGAMFKYRRLQTFINDERAAALRATSYQTGFWVMIVLCIVGYLITVWFPVRAIDVVHLVLSGGVLSVLCAQIVLERR